jgi:hypothetical protein
VPSGRAEVGLCGDCRWARTVETARGSRFVLCRRADTDPRYPKYPRLPVWRCAGHAPGPPDPGEAPPSPSVP